MVGGRCLHRPPIIALLSYGCQLADSRPTVPLRSPTLSYALLCCPLGVHGNCPLSPLGVLYLSVLSSPCGVQERQEGQGGYGIIWQEGRNGKHRGYMASIGGRCLHRPPYCPLSALRSPLSYCPLSAHVRESTSAHVKGLLGVQDGKYGKHRAIMAMVGKHRAIMAMVGKHRAIMAMIGGGASTAPYYRSPLVSLPMYPHTAL